LNYINGQGNVIYIICRKYDKFLILLVYHKQITDNFITDHSGSFGFGFLKGKYFALIFVKKVLGNKLIHLAGSVKDNFMKSTLANLKCLK
jgi:hypothetical protein